MRITLFFLSLAISSVFSDVCPPGYQQAPYGWDCFEVVNFLNIDGRFEPHSYEEVEGYCSSSYGGMLASIHSPEENAYVIDYHRCFVSTAYTNIGLKCKGKVCKWDDGSPVTYTNFKGSGPPDDSVDRCFSIAAHYDATWVEHDCGMQKEDCWACRVKARTIECSEDETEYKGGCISVHSAPLDRKSAEASCPGGGKLVRIHSSENSVYLNAALNAGVNGTIYIGGQFAKDQFEWTDGSVYNYKKWANGFPKRILGACTQMLLASEFGVQGQWTNVDCTTKQPYMCFRDGANYDPALHPLGDPKCAWPLSYYYDTSKIYSANYPFSIPSNLSCEYNIGVDFAKKASVKFTLFDCQSRAFLALYDDITMELITTFNATSPPVLNQTYSAKLYKLKMVFNTTIDPVGTGWEAEVVWV